MTRNEDGDGVSSGRWYSRRDVVGGLVACCATATLAGCSQSSGSSNDEEDEDEADDDGSPEDQPSVPGQQGTTDGAGGSGSATGQTGFPVYLADPSASGGTQSGPTSGFNVRWQNEPFDFPVNMRYVVVGETTYLAEEGGAAAVGPSGDELWSNGKGSSVGPFYTDERLVSLTNSTVRVLDPESGSQERTIEVGDIRTGYGLAQDGYVYLTKRAGAGLSSYRLVAVDVVNGEVTWQTETFSTRYGPGLSEPVLAGDSVYICVNEELQEYDAESGERIQTVGLSHGLDRLVAVDGTLYGYQDVNQPGTNERLLAVDTENLEVLWTTRGGRSPTGDVQQQLVADENHVYFPYLDGYAAFDTDTGEQAWTFSFSDGLRSGPALSASRLYIPTRNGIRIVDTDDGTQTTMVSADRPKSVSVVGNRLYSVENRQVVVRTGEESA